MSAHGFDHALAAGAARASTYRRLRWVFVGLGMAFVAREIWSGAADYSGTLPGVTSLLGAFALSLLWLVCSALGWIALFEESTPAPQLARSYFAALLGRYIPGGVWHAVGQVQFSAEVGVPRRRAAGLLALQMSINVIAGGVVGAGILVSGADLPGWLQVSAAVGLTGLPLLHRRCLVAISGRLASTRLRTAPDAVPSQRSICRAFAWSTAGLCASGAAFGVLASPAAGGVSAVTAIPAFGFAWTIGFLCLPLPSGIGVREAMLMLVLPGGGPVLAAVSVAHRVVGGVAELVMVAVVSSGRTEGVWRARRHASGRRASATRPVPRLVR